MWIFILILLAVFIIVSLFRPSRKDSELAEQYIQDKEQRHREEMKSKSSIKPLSQTASISDVRGKKLFELEPDERSRTLCMLAEKYQAESTNPKFHRTPQEKEALTEFSIHNRTTIEKYEARIYNNGNTFDKNRNVSDQIFACKSSISALDEFRAFCYQSNGGKIYFQNNWEFCHNSKNPCFSYRSTLEDRLNYLIVNENDLRYVEQNLPQLRHDLITYLSEHSDVIQKNIYADFNKLFKSHIQKELRLMEQEGIIKRTKTKGSYLLELI